MLCERQLAVVATRWPLVGGAGQEVVQRHQRGRVQALKEAIAHRRALVEIPMHVLRCRSNARKYGDTPAT